MEEITNNNVKLFIEKVFIERNYSVGSQRQLISALKNFIVFYPNAKISNLKQKIFRGSRKLPNVLSREEVLYNTQLKHRSILALISKL